MLNYEELKKQELYFLNSYAQDFRFNQGTDHLLEMIHRFSVNGTWIDLGGGVNTFFWAAAFKQINSIMSIDYSIEALLLNEYLKIIEYDKGSYGYVFNRFKIDKKSLYNIRCDYKQGDLLENSIHKMIRNKYDNVSQFGLLGLCKSKEEYLNKLQECLALMKPNGVFLGANWVFENILISERGYNNKYLSENLIADFCRNHNYLLIYVKEIPIFDDKNYSNLLIYSIKKKR